MPRCVEVSKARTWARQIQNNRRCLLDMLAIPQRLSNGKDQRQAEFLLPKRSKEVDLCVRRIRDREDVKFVVGHPCLICGRRPADPHHLRFAQSRALGRKVSDDFTVPLCRGHHREIHRCGDEAAWWAKVGVEPLGAANALWRQTHPLT
jgi:hypothetical protein